MKRLSVLDETLEVLGSAREKSDAIMVSFSGGRDSMVVLDLCLRVFKRVEAFFMYLVPGLDVVERPAMDAAARFGVPLHFYPHWITFRIQKLGVYGWQHDRPWAKGRDIKIRDIYSLVIADHGIPLIACGAKRTDSLWRKRYLDSTKEWSEVINPIVAWSKHEVAAYLAQRGLGVDLAAKRSAAELAAMRGRSGGEDEKVAGGMDLSKGAVCRLYDLSPRDFAVLEAAFPFVGAILMQRAIHEGKKPDEPFRIKRDGEAKEG